MNIFFLIIVLTSSFSLFGQHHKENDIELIEVRKNQKNNGQWSHFFNLLDQKNNIETVIEFLITQINKTPAGYIDIHPIVKRKATKHYRSSSQGKKAYQHILPLINLACITDKSNKLESELQLLSLQRQRIVENINGPDSPFISRNK